ncbi:MAG: ANTAR domain-containing protein [Gammaproteobacteria bacterium]|nr:ANTAR domain-containing protein [Gammaproteobacteria bacterium]
MTTQHKVLLAAQRHDRALLIEHALAAAKHHAVAAIAHDDDLMLGVRRSHADAMIVEADESTPHMLTQWGRIMRSQPLPIVVFVDRGDATCVRMAVQAGVSAFVVDGLKRERVLPVLEAAVTRFQQFVLLREQRDEAITRLAERRDIERAKGVLMRRRNLNEQAAYSTLRQMAMDRGMRMIDVAESLLTAEDLLLRS